MAVHTHYVTLLTLRLTADISSSPCLALCSVHWMSALFQLLTKVIFKCPWCEKHLCAFLIVTHITLTLGFWADTMSYLISFSFMSIQNINSGLSNVWLWCAWFALILLLLLLLYNNLSAGSAAALDGDNYQRYKFWFKDTRVYSTISVLHAASQDSSQGKACLGLGH